MRSNPILGLIPLVCLVLLIRAVYTSSRRGLSLGYAVGALALVCGLGFLAMVLLAPRQSSVVETNATLDMIGAAVQILAPIAAVVAANNPPRRTS